MMHNYDESVEINRNLNWSYIPNLIFPTGLGKTNLLLQLIKNQRPGVHMIYLNIKYPFESKYQLLFNGREQVGIKRSKNPNAFIYYSQTIDDDYENLEDYNPTKKRKVLIAFDDMIADIEVNKKLKPIVYKRRRKTQHFRCFYITILFCSR